MKHHYTTLFSIFALVAFNSFARVHKFETVRLKSTAGAGIGSALLSESVILNPAPLAFFQSGSIYLQKTDSEYTVEGNNPKEGDNKAVIVADAKNGIKGAVSYIKLNENPENRTRIAGAFAKVIGKKSSLGATVAKVTDENLVDGETKQDSYFQMDMGVFHGVNKNFSMGVVITDISRKKEEDHRVALGMQYVYDDFISIMFDAGTDYRADLKEKQFYKGAIQFKFYDGIFFRAGIFNDEFLKEKGTGVGAGWLSPKLMIDFAIKNTKPFGDSLSNMAYKTTVKETALALSYLF